MGRRSKIFKRTQRGSPHNFMYDKSGEREPRWVAASLTGVVFHCVLAVHYGLTIL